MLKPQQNRVVEEAIERFEADGRYKALYASVVGSRARGMEVFGSDIDLIVFFMKRDDQRVLPRYGAEGNAMKIDTGDRYINSIRLWDILSTADLFTSDMAAGTDRMLGNYRDAFLALFGEMHEDPFGVLKILCAYDRDAVRANLLYAYENQLNFEVKSDKVKAKTYLKAIYAASIVKWLLTKETVPPVEWRALSATFGEEIINEVNKLKRSFELGIRGDHSTAHEDQEVEVSGPLSALIFEAKRLCADKRSDFEQLSVKNEKEALIKKLSDLLEAYRKSCFL